MASDPHAEAPALHGSVEMPRRTVAPLVLALGVTLLAAGVLFGVVFFIVGAVIFLTGLGMWVGELLPGRGHEHEPFVEPSLRAKVVTGDVGGVQRLVEGLPGYRMRMPEEVHPISAGVKGGIVGGLVIPIPALLYGLLSSHGVWYPVNLLAGMVIPGVGTLTVPELEQFRLSFLIVGMVIHVVMSVILGLIYGVLLPTLPEIPGPISWGGLLMPLLWTAVSFLLMGVVAPVLEKGINWPWFIFSQFVFGVVAASVLLRFRRFGPIPAGLLGGLVGSAVMPLPALLWSLASGHSIWYPVNLLAGMVLPEVGKVPAGQLELFRADWLIVGLVLHLGMSLGIGAANGLLLLRLPPIPGPMAWGGLLMPLLWTGASYSLMGVVNPVLQHLVDWPWFIVSQFLFGVAASIVVVRSELVYIQPAGRGPDRVPITASSEAQAEPEANP